MYLTLFRRLWGEGLAWPTFRAQWRVNRVIPSLWGGQESRMSISFVSGGLLSKGLWTAGWRVGGEEYIPSCVQHSLVIKASARPALLG